MRYLPLVLSDFDPQAWAGTQNLELMWSTPLHPAWAGRVRAGTALHAIHFPEMVWDNTLIETAAQALSERLEPDFLVFRAQAPNGRQGTASFLRVLTALLEATHPRGVKIALRAAPGAAGTLAALLKEIRGEAVGFCWDSTLGPDLEAVSDRLFCAVGHEGVDLAPLLRLGYRWNLALEAQNLPAFHSAKAAFEAAFAPVVFPAELPTHALGRPVLPDEAITFGQGFGGGRGR